MPYPQLASALIEATPEWWTHATLVLDCPPEGLGSGLAHAIFKAEFPQDVVVATDEVMIATRMLELSRGYEILYPLTDEPWGVRRFHLRDPNGVIINLMRHATR